MTGLAHFPTRTLIVHESSPDDFKKLGIGKAELQEDLSLPGLPPTFSIRNEMTPVRDQGFQGSCTSFGVLACLEHIYQRNLSEAQIQHDAEHKHGDCNEGLAMVHSFDICKSPGAIDDILWVYDDTKVCWDDPPNIAGANRYSFQDYAYVYRRPRSTAAPSSPTATSIPGLPLTLEIQRQLFARRRPVCVSVPVVWTSWGWSGDVTMPVPSSPTSSSSAAPLPDETGWHTIPVCGWDNTTGRFLFKNSWGPFWGDRGYGTIPFQYIDHYSDLAIIGW